MAPKSGGGIKRSSWLTFRRRLLLVRALLRDSAPAADLIATINVELGEQGYPVAATAALKHDFDALKGEYGCRIVYSRANRHYVLVDLGELALLDLPDTVMEALAFLEATFPEADGLPEHAHIRALLERVLLLLPPARQAQYRRQRSTIRISVSKPMGVMSTHTLTVLKRAIANRRELTFAYLSTFDDDTPRQHRVAPYGITVHPEGHAYLDATLLEVTPPAGEQIHAAIDYRIDRIIPDSLVILPTVLPAQRVSPPIYHLRYTLVPQVASRRDIAPLFPATQISYLSDGRAEITADITNLGQAHQLLLRYGDACTVHEPPELVSLFQVTARGLNALYLAEM